MTVHPFFESGHSKREFRMLCNLPAEKEEEDSMRTDHSLTRLGRKGYFIQDLPLLALCEKYGTPLYLYDADAAVARFKELESAFPWPKTKIYYAMKANYNPHLLRALKRAGARIDTVSVAEALLALQLGFKPRDIIYTANSTSDEDMRLMHGRGILVNVDCLSALERFGKMFPGSEVCARFNPDVVAGEDAKVQTSGDATKFGILLEDAPKVLAIARKYKLKIVGLHEHIGSGIDSTAKVFKGMDDLMNLALRQDFADLRFIDFGGGFKAPYRPGEKRIDYAAFGKKVARKHASFCKQYGRDLELYFEPGKYVAAECGMLVVRVNTVKRNRQRLIAGTDSGFGHLIRPVFYGAYHHVLNLSNPKGRLKNYDVCGNICESGDLFAQDRDLPEIREGDYLGILNAGGYCFAMASIYNLRPLPAEIVIQKGKASVSRKRLSPQDLVDEIMAIYGQSK